MTTEPCPAGMEGLVEVVQRLSLARDLATLQDIVRRAARHLTGADGATFVLRDGDRCFYADEDAIAPLWKGQRFPMSACISGWSMLHRRPAVIADIYADDRIPHDAYRPTFVKSLVMVPIRTLDPIGAIGNYWASSHVPSEAEVKLLQALADTTAVALENVRVFTELEDRVRERTAELEKAIRQLEATNRELLAAHQQADRVFRAYARALPGTVLDGKYRLDEELGSGGFGVVFRGWHLVLDGQIAVKVFRPVPGNDSALALQRFLREGAAASRLAHTNAVRVFDSGVSSEGVAYLIMELLQGRSLAAELAERGLPSLKRCATIAGRVADVLASAHRQGILHRDIKPENVFLHHGDAGETVKVVDFGIARFFGNDQPAGADRLTRTGDLIGTPNFIAPERVAGRADDGRSDVFSLGAMLYQMICGAMPWSAEEKLRMAWGLGQRTLPPVMAGLRRGVPAELEALVSRSLAWEAQERPTAADLAAALDRLSEGLEDVPGEWVRPAEPAVTESNGSTPAAAEVEEVPDWWLTGSR
jgi:hypothetical protein